MSEQRSTQNQGQQYGQIGQQGSQPQQLYLVIDEQVLRRLRAEGQEIPFHSDNPSATATITNDPQKAQTAGKSVWRLEPGQAMTGDQTSKRTIS